MESLNPQRLCFHKVKTPTSPHSPPPYTHQFPIPAHSPPLGKALFLQKSKHI